jgi:ABC-type transporter MlaC component
MKFAQSLRSLLLTGTLVVPVLVPTSAEAWLTDPGAVPMRQNLPNGIDLLESSLYWLQDLSGVDDPRDPAAIVSLMEDQAARFFDFSYMAYLVAGPAYSRLNVLERSHFQNRIRDRLFSGLAYKMGMNSSRLPRFHPIMPVQTSLWSWTAGGQFYHLGGPNIRLVFHFYMTPRGWRIYDVTSNGMSAVAGLRRSYFANLFDK